MGDGGAGWRRGNLRQVQVKAAQATSRSSSSSSGGCGGSVVVVTRHGMNVAIEKIRLFLGLLRRTARGNAGDASRLLYLIGMVKEDEGFPVLLFGTGGGKYDVVVGSVSVVGLLVGCGILKSLLARATPNRQSIFLGTRKE
jgi:hypothetical protein